MSKNDFLRKNASKNENKAFLAFKLLGIRYLNLFRIISIFSLQYTKQKKDKKC